MSQLFLPDNAPKDKKGEVSSPTKTEPAKSRKVFSWHGLVVE